MAEAVSSNLQSPPPKGVWVKWTHQRPPLDTEVEGAWTSVPAAEDNITRGKRCRRGCCFDADIGNLIAPVWWRIPE